MSRYYFVKSLEEDFHTKTVVDGEKKSFQSLDEMIKTKTIKPNTVSFKQKRRLSTTIIHKNYLKTYRSRGIIFQTDDEPDHVLPFDLAVLTDAKKIIVQYYRIKNSIQTYYNHSLIDGFDQFIFKDFTSLIKKYPNTHSVWKAVNAFRDKSGYKSLPDSKKRLVEYNEAVFYKNVKIKPVAIYGYRKEAREMAKKHQLPHYRNAKEFYSFLNKK